jgi:hypothetical protein
MKPVLVFVLTFLVATAASTGAKVMMTKPVAKAAGADSTKRDSTRTDSTSKLAGDSARTDTAAAPSGQAVKPPADTLPVAAAAEAATVKVAAAPRAHPAPAVATPPDTVEKRIAKVFTSMDPKRAAAVLGHMSDGDVGIILGYVGVKQAAAIMAELPPERVATLSKMAIKGGGGGGDQ